MRCGVVAVLLSLAACHGHHDVPPSDAAADAVVDAAVDADIDSAPADAPMPLAAPTGVVASDGTSLAYVQVTWDAVTGATGYRVYRDGVAVADTTALGLLDFSAGAGQVSAPVLTASQGTSTAGVNLTWTPAVCMPGATASYTVTTLNGSIEGVPSAPDTGFRGAYAVTGYQLSIDSGVTFPYDAGTGTSLFDDNAPLGTLVASVTASAGSFNDHVALALSSVTSADGAVVHYAIRAQTTGPLSPPSNIADGWRTTGAVTVQWNRHVFRPMFGEVIGPIYGATSSTYSDTQIAANTLYGYDCALTAPGAATVSTTPVPGWRTATAGETPRATWVTDGEVAAIASTSNAIYLGGSFHYVGPATGAFVTLDATTGATNGSALRVVPSIDGNPRGVATAIRDGSGGWYLGGGFVAIGGVPQPRLAHITATGALDRAFAPMVLDGDVTAIALAGTTLYVAGTFTKVGWQPRAGFAALDATTGALQAFAPVLTSADPSVPGSVSSMMVLGSNLYVGGNFTSIAGAARVGFAAIDLASQSVVSWDPHADCRGSIDAAIGNVLYISGCFTHIGVAARTALAAVDATTATAQQFDPEPDSTTIHAVVTDGSAIYVAGNFHTIGGQLRNGLAALDPQTGAARSFQTPALDPSGTVSALAIAGPTLYLGGAFASLGGAPRANLAAVNAQTGAALPWAPVTSAPVASLAVSNSTVFVGGELASVGGQAASNLAVLDPTTGVLSRWGSGTDGIVYALAIAPDGQSVFAGGQFLQAGGQPRVDLAELDASGAATTWSADTDGIVYDLAVANTTLYAGGEFHHIGGQPRAALAAIDATTATPTAFAPNPNAPIGHIAITGNNVIVSPPHTAIGFSTIGGQTRHFLAAVDATTGLATSWAPEPDGIIDDIVVAGNLLYLCGAGLERIAGQNRDVVAAFTLPAFTLTSLTTNASLGGPSAFALLGNVIYGSGLMFNGGFDTSGAFDAATDAIESWKPGMADIADRVIARGTSIIEVGDIHYAAGYPNAGIVIFDP